MIQRRVYLYIVAAASLGMLLVGLANVGTTAINQALKVVTPGESARDAYAGFGAVLVVGLPVWGIHWGIAQRLSARRLDERGSALRRLYLYLVLGALGISAALAARSLLEDLFATVAGPVPQGAAIARSTWVAGILVALWLYHFKTASRDRQAVPETGAAATLRRWYAYTLLLAGLAFLLYGARNLLQQLWLLLTQSNLVVPGSLIGAALATMLVGLAVWAFHSIWTLSPPIVEDDRRSTLRAVQAFLALAGSVIMALFGASQLLYYVLARTLGVAQPGGVSGSLLAALALPGSTVIVFASAWIWLGGQLARDAGDSEVARQASVRRIYTHLVAFVALGTLAVGAAGLLWTLAEQLLNPLTGVNAGEWRDRTSLFVTLAIVGTPMWLTHWRPRVEVAERHTLSRRIYVYAALLASVLALLVSAAILIYRLLGLLLGTSTASSGAAVVDVGRNAAVIVVAVAFGLYHWRTLRQDGAMRQASPPDSVAPPGPFALEVSGVSEDELRRILAGLPQAARYTLRRR